MSYCWHDMRMRGIPTFQPAASLLLISVLSTILNLNSSSLWCGTRKHSKHYRFCANGSCGFYSEALCQVFYWNEGVRCSFSIDPLLDRL
ncbi:hypothetical protein EV401DRAFT_464959 [Pisolithus croceorrhizus]|nr:hypothetical protein EV401DRAFT_464959 [Pisolithus croceorrhizus]